MRDSEMRDSEMRDNEVFRRAAAGAVEAIVLAAALSTAMLPLRSHLSVATTALVLVVPVVLAVARGGFWAGIAAAACGFFIYDLVFIPPYYTLDVGAGQNWTALGVYAAVTVLVARVVARVNRARAEAQRRASEVRRLFDLSELLVRQSTPQLSASVVRALQQAFGLEGAALVLPLDGRLTVVAETGSPLSESELARLAATTGEPVRLEGADVGRSGVQTVALVASGEAIGLLVLQGLAPGAHQHELLRACANQLALALERGQLHEQAMRAELLEEVDRLRRSLVGAVSHDLRTPLATIKLSASALLDPESSLSSAEARELIGLVDQQADRLDRLVANLLDLTRIQSGTLELRREVVPVEELVEGAIGVLGSGIDRGRLSCVLEAALPPVEVDPILAGQVLANLIDNALRYSPEHSDVEVAARLVVGGAPDRPSPALGGPESLGAQKATGTRPRARAGATVEISVSDHGPGVSLDGAPGIFQLLNRREAGGRGGLGLAIAKAFVEAHGEQIRVNAAEHGDGSRFAFTLPAAATGAGD